MSIKGHLSWIGLDWGTSNLRAWGLDEAGEIVETARSNAGMGGLNPQEFEPALLDVIGEWLAPFHNTRQVPVICCGMVGARDGWAEAGYEKVPFKPGDMGEATSVPTLDKRLDVRILSGLSQHTPPDVMRGEETQIAGWLSKNPHWSGIVCLPGTHSKWVEIRQGEIVGFSTFVTGEMFGLLVKHSLLASLANRSVWNDGAFLHGLNKGFDEPQKLTNRLFSLRARSLLEEGQTVHASSEISGLLIGFELKAMEKTWANKKTILIGAKNLVARYKTAIQHLGGNAQCEAGNKMALAGLIAAARQMGVIAP